MAKSTRGMRRGRGDVMEMWQAPKQALPVQILGVLIRWRAELFVGTVFVLYVLWINSLTSDEVLRVLAILGPIAVLAVIPWTRRFFVARFWCVVDRHRFRTCLRNARFRTMTLDGSFPFLLWARPTKTGERIWIWTRAGSSGEEIESVLSYIAPACYARDARLHPTKWIATLVAVDVVRRDLLNKGKPVDSALAQWSEMHPSNGRTTAEGTEPITAATVLPIPVRRDAGEATAPRAPRNGRKNTAPATAAEQGKNNSVLVGGEDLSDYID